MRRTWGFLPLAGLFVSVLLGMGAAVADPPTPYVPDQVLVKFRPGTPASEVARAHASAHAAIRDEIPQIGVQIVGLPPGLSVGKAIGFYERNPNVEFVEPDYYVEPALTPNDPWYANWQRDLQQMGSEAAWDITTGSSSVPIAILDSGADFDHPDLQGRLVAGWDFVADDADPMDEHWHGTAVTGVAGATTNNAFGIAGVTWQNPVLVVRIGDSHGYATSGRMAQGITHAADQGARAINLSFATPSYLSTVASAVSYAWSRGAVTVASAGNESSSAPHYPAALPNVVGVSGITGSDEFIYYSNYGTWVDVCATAGSRTLMLGGGIGDVGGTSISAPYVTGLFGLVFSANTTLTPQQAVDIVCQTATDLGDPGFDEYYGSGKIDLYRAVLAASESGGGGGGPDTTAPSASVTSPAAGAAVSSETAISVSATDDVGVTLVDLYLDGYLVGSLATPPYEWIWDTTMDADGGHTLQAVAYDEAGNVGESSVATVTVDNSPPSTVILDPTDGSLVSGTAPVTADAADAVTGVREVRFYVDDIWQATKSQAPYVWSWDTTTSSQGWHSVVARAVDVAGNEDAASVTVEVQNASDPQPVTETFTGGVGFRKKSSVATHVLLVAEGGAISASLIWGGKADLDLCVYSPAGDLVTSSVNRSRGGSEEVSYTAAEAGTYALEVVAVKGKANYTLTATHP